TYGYEPVFELFMCKLVEITPEVPVIELEGTGQMGDWIRPVIHGQPDSAFILFASPWASVNKAGNLYSHLHLDPLNLFPIVGGTVPAGGSIQYTIELPAGPGPIGVPILFQAYVQTPAGQNFLSTSSAFVIR
ncbi:MAG: hypothetical protein ACYTG7_23210, partial [Planctomycetota bacterium]